MSYTAIITAVASAILLRLLYSFESRLLAAADAGIAWLVSKVHERTGWHVPEYWQATVSKIVREGISIANQVLDRQTLGALFNRVRQNKGDEAVSILAAQLEKVDVTKRLSDQLTPEARADLNAAQEMLAVDHIQAASVPHAALMHPKDEAGKRAADAVMTTEKLIPLIKAAVVAEKAQPAPSLDPITAMRAKSNIQAAIEELRAKLAK